MRHSVIVEICGFALVVGFVGLAFVGVPSWLNVAGVFAGGGFMIWGIFLEGSDNG
jgi:hypothetical protein